jgi:hypothetical protein
LEGIGILPGITTSWMRNPPEEWDSAWNYQLIYDESNQVRGFYWELPAYLQKIQAGKITIRGKSFKR